MKQTRRALLSSGLVLVPMMLVSSVAYLLMRGVSIYEGQVPGRIDSPPTVYEGKVLFGSRDGCVYCLRASDGKLVWRFRAVAEGGRVLLFPQPR